MKVILQIPISFDRLFAGLQFCMYLEILHLEMSLGVGFVFPLFVGFLALNHTFDT